MTGRHAAGQDGAAAAGTIAALEADIARQRAALADTVGQLQAKLDVKARAQHQVHDLRDRMTTDDGRPTKAVLAIAAGVAVLVGAIVVLRRRG